MSINEPGAKPAPGQEPPGGVETGESRRNSFGANHENRVAGVDDLSIDHTRKHHLGSSAHHVLANPPRVTAPILDPKEY